MFSLTERRSPPALSWLNFDPPPPTRKIFLPVCPSSKGAQPHQAYRWLGAPTRDTPSPIRPFTSPPQGFLDPEPSKAQGPLQIQNLQPLKKDDRARKAKRRCGDAAQALGVPCPAWPAASGPELRERWRDEASSLEGAKTGHQTGVERS